MSGHSDAWCIGVWPARHAHLIPRDGSARAPQVSWLAADPVEVAPALRTAGTLANRGRVYPVADPALFRARRQREQAGALAAHERLREALLTDTGVRLSAFAGLPVDAFAELLSLLASGLDAPLAGDGTRRALSADGRVEIVLCDVGDGRVAAITTESGVLRGPDLLVMISLADTVAQEQEAAGA